MAFHEAEDANPQFARTLIMGEPGIGKTLLGSTNPDTLILDLEDRAAHAKRMRETFTKDRVGFKELQDLMKTLVKLRPGPDGTLPYKARGQVHPIRVVQLDSLDELQLNINLILHSSGFEYWGEMLELMRGIITQGRMLNCHFVAIAHTRLFGSDTKDVMPEVNLALQGQAAQQVPRWFDVILNMVYDARQQQGVVLTRNTVIGGVLYRAKDALNLFGGHNFPLNFVDGRPDPKIMDKVLAATAGGVVHLTDNPDELHNKFAGELSRATSQPIPPSEFKTICKEHGWDLTDGSEARQALLDEFGSGYDPQRGADYVEFLVRQFGGNGIHRG